MTVKELIAVLKNYDSDLEVQRHSYSGYIIDMSPTDMDVIEWPGRKTLVFDR